MILSSNKKEEEEEAQLDFFQEWW